jgi:mono/diheme cytochrome c family protein
MVRFGAPTLAWETRFDYPHLWGTRRIGPDLARETVTHSEDWQYAHLFAPRSVAPDSVMPSYSSLFNGAATRPTQEARDLVAYLDSLGRARELAAPEGEAHAREACNCADDEMAQMAFHAASINTNPARARRQSDAPKLSANGDLTRGKDIYLHNCAGCHGAAGLGNGAAASALQPAPANLAEHEYSLDRLSSVLRNGSTGTSMPAWRDFPVDDLSAIAAAVRSFHTTQNEPAPPANIGELGARVYAENCVQCHGPDGGGDGTAVSELRTLPANFRQQRPSVAQSLRALRFGVAGTQMAPWTDRLNEAEISAVAYYVRGLYGSVDAPRQGKQ